MSNGQASECNSSENLHKNKDGEVKSGRWIGLTIALVLAVVAYIVIPTESLDEAGEVVGGLSHTGRAVVAIAVLIATLWVTEALPIAVTALLPIVLFPLCTGGAITVKSAASPYAHELIFLFMGGFMISLAMQRWGLHRRIALHTILIIGTRPTLLVGGLMVSCAFLSMWVSNTATVVMMLPIAMSVVELVRRELRDIGDPNLPPNGEPFNFAICLMLGIAYAASIGGIGTLIGTPPNALMAAFLKDNYQIEISFVKWMAISVPLVIVFLPIAWLLLTRMVFPVRIRRIPGGRELILKELKSQGPLSRGELMVLIVFIITAVMWMTRPLLVRLQLPGGVRPLAGLSDPGIAVGAAIVLFCLPVDFKRGMFVLTWQQARKLPWGVLILFGGGLSLAAAIKTSGAAEFIGRGVSGFQDLSMPVMTLLVSTTSVSISQLTSNISCTATLLPIFSAVADGFGLEPLLLVIPTTIAASLAFMLPVSTPPNAIVFASGEVTIPQMCKAGLWLNIVGIGLVLLLMYLVVIPVFG
ncbi:MAG: SLC13 family permease [Planctomycetota bacterium]|jgi:sodium-dependent dicarboxylate transporter 2/3/5